MFIILLVVLPALLLNRNVNKVPVNTPTPVPVITPSPTPVKYNTDTIDVTSLDTPALPDGTWTVDTSKTSMDISCHDYQKRGLCSHKINLTGKTYVNSVAANELPTRHPNRPDLAAFTDKLQGSGWGGVVVDDVVMSIGSGDGPYASATGYVAKKGDMVRVVYVEDYLSYVSADENTFVVRCPCKEVYKVFISDPFSWKESII